MACGRCGQRREEIDAALKAVAAGDLGTASATLAHVAKTMSEDAGALARVATQRLAAAHARLRR